MPNPTRVIGIIEVETTAELSVVLYGSVTKEKKPRWLQGASQAVAADLDSLKDNLSDEYDAFCERLAT
jgi:hypothetical protein